MQDTLRQCESEVEQARARLGADLAVLRSPRTFAAFTEDLKQDALETKDELVDQAKQAVQSRANDVVEELKAKAAANPTAALMIGAGLGWYLLRHPPITTALVGFGLFSLLRTPAVAKPQASVRDHLREGGSRLKEQVSDFATQAGEQASHLAAEAGAKVAETSSEWLAAAKDKSGELVESAKDSITRLSHDARDQVAAGSSTVKSQVKAQVDSLITKAGAMSSDLSERARAGSEQAAAGASRRFDETVATARSTLTDPTARDRVLLGVAGLAVAAALGMACQRRMTENP
jgi:hypothetical protein